MFTYIDPTVRKRLEEQGKLFQIDRDGARVAADHVPANGAGISVLGPIPLPLNLCGSKFHVNWYACVRRTELGKIEEIADELRAQFDFVWGANRKLTETHQAIIDIRRLRTQMNDLMKKLEGDDSETLLSKIKKTLQSMDKVEKALYQTRNQSRQDPLNYPIKLNNKLAALGGYRIHGRQQTYRPGVCRKGIPGKSH